MKLSNVPDMVDSCSLVYIQISIKNGSTFNQEIEVINGDGFALTKRLIETMIDAFGFNDKTVKFSYGDDCLIYRDGNIERCHVDTRKQQKTTT